MGALTQEVNSPSEEFVSLQEHFQFNIDESCFMFRNGVLKIIGDGSKKKHDKNTSGNRVSITTVCVGNVAGNNGPIIFLANGKQKNLNRLFTPKRMVLNSRFL